LKKLVIAIDGPAASGKSTTARLAAKRLGYLHIDTGAMYRAITLKVLRLGIDPADRAAIGRMLPDTRIELVEGEDGVRVLLDGEDVSGEIRREAVTTLVSAVSSLREVRDAMVREQRRMGASGGIVLEGRDIGTVVFPGADLKFFMSARIETRATRRQRELDAAGVASSADSLMKEIEERDRRDSTREESPLRKASDAIEVDTTGMSIDDQVNAVVGRAEELLKRRERS